MWSPSDSTFAFTPWYWFCIFQRQILKSFFFRYNITGFKLLTETSWWSLCFQFVNGQNFCAVQLQKAFLYRSLLFYVNRCLVSSSTTCSQQRKDLRQRVTWSTYIWFLFWIIWKRIPLSSHSSLETNWGAQSWAVWMLCPCFMTVDFKTVV